MAALFLVYWVARRNPSTAFRWWVPISIILGLVLYYFHSLRFVHPAASGLLALCVGWQFAGQCYLLQEKAAWTQDQSKPDQPGGRPPRNGRLFGATIFFFGSLFGALFLQWDQILDFPRWISLLLSFFVLVLAAVVWEGSRRPSRREGIAVRGMTPMPDLLRLARFASTLLLLVTAALLFTRVLAPTADGLSVLIPETNPGETGEGEQPAGTHITRAPETTVDRTNLEVDSTLGTGLQPQLQEEFRKPSLWWRIKVWLYQNRYYVGAFLVSLLMAWLVHRQRRRTKRRGDGQEEALMDEEVEIELSQIPQPKFLEELCRIGERLGLPRNQGTTVPEYVRRLQRADLPGSEKLGDLADYYSEVRYGGAAVDRKRERGIWAILREFKANA